jgi:hypothetical protein
MHKQSWGALGVLRPKFVVQLQGPVGLTTLGTTKTHRKRTKSWGKVLDYRGNEAKFT